jgi:FAD:protein FMN transferase
VVDVATTGEWRHLRACDWPAMGGRLAIDVTLPVERGTSVSGDASQEEAVARQLAIRAGRRMASWAARLTRFDPASDLSRLNANRAAVAPLRPTIGAVLAWAADASALTGGIVDAALLRERLAAETSEIAVASRGSWSLSGSGRTTVVERAGSVAFDLDGVAKGWLADRALALLWPVAGAIVDADGDIAIRLAPGEVVEVGVADPRDAGVLVAELRLADDGRRGARFGIATSGTSIHRWVHGGTATHHLIDPRTGRPAVTDLLQATVVGGTARHAEALAKTAVILGLEQGTRVLERAGAFAAVLLTEAGQCVAVRPPSTRLEAA